MEKTIFLIAGGEIGDIDFIRDRLADADDGDIICADGGARYLFAIGRVPAVIVGDMDSLDQGLIDHFIGLGCRMIRHPEQKDKTDAQLALEYAFTLDPKRVTILGGTGGRLDHTLANLSLMVLGAERAVDVRLIDEWCEIFLVTDRMVLAGEAGQTVSLFPMAESAGGIYLDGFEYPLRDGTMRIGHPFGVSNRLIGKEGVVAVGSGSLLGIRYHKAGVFPGRE